jgi:hypothetical protein
VESRWFAGGILRLRELIEEHPSEFAYDFRHRFNIGLHEVGYRIPYGEAILLTGVLLRDPSSWLQAAVNEWKHPASMEWMILVQQLDAFVMANSKTRPKPTPMPWQGPKRYGKPTVSEEKVRAVLDAMRPKENDG